MDSGKLKELIDLSKNVRVLYVEDDEIAREGMMYALDVIFNHISVATNGLEGLESFRAHEYDLIISDITMPKMTGIEMIDKIRKLSPSIPILILSASSEGDVFAQTVPLGIDGYLLKPLEMSQFIDVLWNTMRKIHLIHENDTRIAANP